jgi:tripartite-type tricarboxylate transporter receptor subunit TctC
MSLIRRAALKKWATVLSVASVAALSSLGSAPVFAQAWPAKTVTMIVSYPPGGDSDALARVFAEKLAARIGQQVVVENRPGASGTIGNALVAKAAPDGYTLLWTPSTIATATLVLKAGTGAQYDVLNDFTPIIHTGHQSLFVVVNTATGITNLKDMVAAVKAGKLPTYASPGSGSPMHLLGEMFNKSAGIKMQQVPYRGSGPAITDLVGGHVNMMYTTLGPVAPHISTGKLRNVAVADSKRSPLAPDVPTLAELGFKDSEIGAWQGVFGPRGLPADVVRSLNAHFNEILKMPDVQARMVQLALVGSGGDPSVLARALANDNERYGKVIKEFGIQAE